MTKPQGGFPPLPEPKPKSGEELDSAAKLAKNIADRVIFTLRLRGMALEEFRPGTIVLRETVQGIAQDVILYG